MLPTNTGILLPYTMLSLFRYAQIMGITPLHFAGAQTGELSPEVMPIGTDCGDVWTKYDWQNHDHVSHMQLAIQIKNAEREIAHLLGYWPAPVWLSEEAHPYPRPWAREYSGMGVDVSGRPKTITTRFGKVIAGGRRAVSLIGTATKAGGALVYSDDDVDGFPEHARITLPTALTDEREIKVYHTGYDGDQEWEIRPVSHKEIVGGNIVIDLPTWELIEPSLYEAFPTSDGHQPIDLSDADNLVVSVDVYREYNDNSEPASRFYWENDLGSTCQSCGGVGCEDCLPTTQDGCLTIRDYDKGIVSPFPATNTDGSWSSDTWTECREPESVKLWYYAGLASQDYLRHRSYDPLPYEHALAIAYLATARLDRPLCGCGSAQSIASAFQENMAMSEPNGKSYFLTPDVMQCPFGTKVGEVAAWRMLGGKLTPHRLGVAVI